MKYQIEVVRKFAQEVSMKAGMSQEHAAVFADNLIGADLRGVRSHGMTKFTGYISRLQHEITDPKVEPTIERTAASTLLIDGNNGMGSTIAHKSMEACIEVAKETGVCFATIKRASHHGFGGYYVMDAAKQGMLAFEACNAAALVAPFGGAKPALGTNPISIALPAGKYPDFVLDMATSLVAKGKIALAMKEGKEIPDTWALDADGAPTTDPVKANVGALLPMGGPKGYALALLIDIMCSCLAGAHTSLTIPRVFENMEEPANVGYVMCVIDISKFVELDVFKAQVDAMFESMKATPPAVGFNGVMIPGEIEYNITEKSKVEGIELSAPIVEELRGLATTYDVAFPF